MKSYEVNFDGLVGPTHNYGGLSYGNVASQSNSQQASNPREAARQGLAKMKALADMGFKQGVLAPQERPDVAALRRLGFTGSDAEVIQRAAKQAMPLLVASCSASSMWVANAATVSPSADTADGRVHFTAANLNCKYHRSIEHPTTSRVLGAMFADDKHFAHHEALPAVAQFGDEGAANHTRFCRSYGEAGVEFFVYGRSAFDSRYPAPQKYPARQTLEASQAVVRLHGLRDDGVVYAQQNPAVIDQGVFHNDVISVGNGEVLFYHEDAFLETEAVLGQLQAKLAHKGGNFQAIRVPRAAVAVDDAVRSYLFNSQLLSRDDGSMLLVVPEECRSNERVWAYLEQLTQQGGPVKEVKVFDLKQSMQNGGGPACLRLRVALKESELAAVNPGVIMTAPLYDTLLQWVDKHYRDRLGEAELADPQLLVECRTALDELTQILKLGSVYPFQRQP
ncbi:N-succinylarginine dihydrolase [Pseudomonas kermanshahensis]|jgi:succinylarginine dihydrolase|uniref:N-succinylarginine dihydrolase n=1 Tax=Pseudomonas kermanshahensis TaxID=2745482 RepID=A0ABU8RA15_9PSED|nr:MULTISPECIES: N-succinylarginine dihydrolase [Pseudomonas]MBC3487878.1 N-succinylarginine dihydrolase [Pseudomonas sp. SWRI50]MBC3497935.1 N-succinylarginine dihydrolase [Pseudomonas sp. SWRI67]MBV4528106.1 N-succinylarginine dihydrolase [Pseudomonas kermanshahensis]SMF02318.1 succinylarginine dihydrolase [Pseudomonas sp. LAIL14HWK12:I11]SMR72398.1 succinylarginine dihydrolase [Pseudomonas sp. LAIL14HWK12:I10]